MEKNKSLRFTYLIILVTMVVMSLCACVVKDNSNAKNDINNQNNVDGVNNDGKEDVSKLSLDEINNLDNSTNQIHRIAPDSIDELNIESADAIRWMRFDEKEMEITDKEKVDAIKSAFANIKISTDTEHELYCGGVHFGLYDGEKELCFINLAGSERTGKCYIGNDTYCFLGEISKEDAEIMVDIVGELDNIEE